MDKNNLPHVFFFKCMRNIDSSYIYDITEIISKKFEEDPLVSEIVLDFDKKFTIKQDSLRGLGALALDLRKKFKRLYLYHVEKELIDVTIGMGLNELLIELHDLKDLVVHIPKKKASVDVNFLNPFIEGAIKTIKIQCDIDCIPGKPAVKTESFNHPIDIAGVIGISSKGFIGSIAICFPQQTFLAIMSKMLGEEFEEIDSELEDGAGELLNIIFGHAKKVLNQTGHSLDKAIPTVVRGTDLKVRHITGHACFIIPFKTEYGSFFIEVSAEL